MIQTMVKYIFNLEIDLIMKLKYNHLMFLRDGTMEYVLIIYFAIKMIEIMNSKWSIISQANILLKLIIQLIKYLNQIKLFLLIKMILMKSSLGRLNLLLYFKYGFNCQLRQEIRLIILLLRRGSSLNQKRKPSIQLITQINVLSFTITMLS